MKTTFSKSHLSYKEQIKLLQSRNLIITNEQFAIKKLKHLNYYRLSAYFHPYFEEKNRFRDDTKFEDILQLYYFDKEFRNLIFYAIEKIEVYIRTQISYTLSKNVGVFSYTKTELFHDKKYHEDILKIIQSETKRSKEIFVKEFYEKYDEEYLPIWSMVEIISFNTLSRIYANLNESYRKEIIKDIDIKPFVFQRWLHTLTYVRNISAHHSRLWNKILAIEPMKPKNQKAFELISNKKIFFVLSMIEFLFKQIDDEEFNFKTELKKLFIKYPKVKYESMGFIKNWEQNPIWKDEE